MSKHSQDNVHIMIIDDVDATRAILRDMLEEMGITHISEAVDGHDAFQKLKNERADLIICDLFMDQMNGAELLKTVSKHSQTADIPFIIISACGDPAIIEAALDLGADDYLVKPVSFKLFERKISEILLRTAVGLG